MAGANIVCPATTTGESPAILQFSYPDELGRALRALWHGVVGDLRSAS
jgi:hypothetical protein